MEKRLNGVTYNTNTATQLAKADMRHAGDLYWYVERLYRTKAGAFFLVGIGGELTRWNDDAGLVPLEPEAVEYWLKKHGIDPEGVHNGEERGTEAGTPAP